MSGPPQQAIHPSGHNTNLPTRQFSASSAASDDAVPLTDPRDTSELLAERLQAWKHAVGYLENYVSAIEKSEKQQAKEYEKVLKSIADPLKEGHHFDQSLGGIAGLMENMRSNTQGLANSHADTEKNIKGSVLPILDRLHKEIKNKSRELSSGAVKGAKEVEKARNSTQKHIELLGQETAGYESNGGKISSSNDPYVIQRGVYHRLNHQVLEENNNRQDLLSVQNNFASFEAHIVEVIQQAMASFNQFIGGQTQRDQSMFADMLSTTQHIRPDFEWKGFVNRNHDMLIDPNEPPRSVDNISFANQNHKATQPLIEGTLERKSRNMLSSGYSTGYYVVTASQFLHEFKDNDNLRKDPVPDLSIYLPDATIGQPDGVKFNVKGKDVSKGLSGKLAGSSELSFKAATAADAEKWFEIIRMVAGNAPSAPYGSEPSSPVGTRQQVGTTGGAMTSSPIAEKHAPAGTMQQEQQYNTGAMPEKGMTGMQANQQTMAPMHGGMNSAQQDMQPSQQTMAPVQQGMTTNQQGVLPNQQIMGSGQHSMDPAQQTMAPAQYGNQTEYGMGNQPAQLQTSNVTGQQHMASPTSTMEHAAMNKM